MWLLVVPASLALTVEEVPNPAHDSVWVSDQAQILESGTEADMNRRIDGLNADLGVEIAVVTVQDVPGVPKDFATELFELWGIGGTEANNGLLVLMVVDQRRLEMETGYGLEPVLPDGWLGMMQTERMVPRFREGDFGGGLLAGLVAVDERLRRDPEQASEGTHGAIPGPGTKADAWAIPVWLRWLGWILAAVGLGWLVGRLWRYVRRPWLLVCGDCDRDMVLLSEEDEDAHLVDGQQAEERLGSAEWKVWHCPDCGKVKVEGVSNPESMLKRCPSCERITLASGVRLLSLATANSKAEMEISESCGHCDYESSRVERPKKINQHLGAFDAGYNPGGSTFHGGIHRRRSSFGSSSSSRSPSSGSRSSSRRSSSSRGSFGGGRSGGGGAGSSW